MSEMKYSMEAVESKIAELEARIVEAIMQIRWAKAQADRPLMNNCLDKAIEILEGSDEPETKKYRETGI